MNIPMKTVFLSVLLLTVMVGCNRTNSKNFGSFDDYGKEYGRDAGYASVDGLSIFLEMIRSDNRKVHLAKRISPLIDRFDTVVWCPNRRVPPSEAVIQRLEQWLDEGSTRSIIFVPPGFRGQAEFKKRQLDLVADEKLENENALRRYNEYLNQTGNMEFDLSSSFHYFYQDVEGQCKWFSQSSQIDQPITEIDGTWSHVLEASQADLRTGDLEVKIEDDLPGRYPHSLRRESERLIGYSTGSFLSRIYSRSRSDLGQVFVFSNGSAIMNLGMTNAENRKLARNLIDQTRGDVIVLESGPVEIEIRNRYTSDGGGWQWMTRKPISYIIPYLLLLSVIAFFAVFPIHGRPRRIDLEVEKTFGDHIKSTGRLLSNSANRTWAEQTIKRYKAQSSEK